MLGIIPDWLTNWFVGAARVVGQGAADVIHWAVHALAVVIIAVFERVLGAWKVLAEWSWAFLRSLGAVMFAIAGKLFWILRVVVPRVAKLIFSWVAFLLRFIRSWVAWLWKQIRATIALLYQQISAVIRWAVTHIFDPLWRWAQFLWRLVKAWAWVAFWWISHPGALAERLIFWIAASLERNAWALAGILGKFFTALFVRNLARAVRLFEAILTAVL